MDLTSNGSDRRQSSQSPIFLNYKFGLNVFDSWFVGHTHLIMLRSWIREALEVVRVEWVVGKVGIEHPRRLRAISVVSSSIILSELIDVAKPGCRRRMLRAVELAASLVHSAEAVPHREALRLHPRCRIERVWSRPLDGGHVCDARNVQAKHIRDPVRTGV